MRFQIDRGEREFDQDVYDYVSEVARRIAGTHSLPVGDVEAALLRVAAHSNADFQFARVSRNTISIVEAELSGAAASGAVRPRDALTQLAADTTKTMGRIATVRWINYRGLPLYDHPRLYALLSAAASPQAALAAGALRRQSYWPSAEFERTFGGPFANRWPQLFRHITQRARSRKTFERIAPEIISSVLSGVETGAMKAALSLEARRLSAARAFVGQGRDLVGHGPYEMLLTALWIGFELKRGVFAEAAKTIRKEDLFYERPRFGVRLRADHYFALSPRDVDRLFQMLRRLQRDLRPLLSVDLGACAQELGWGPLLPATISPARDVRGLGPTRLFASETIEWILGCTPPPWWPMSVKASVDVVSWATEERKPEDHHWLSIVGLIERFGPFSTRARRVVENILRLPVDAEFSFKDVRIGSMKKRDIFRLNEEAADALFEHVGGKNSRFRLKEEIRKALARAATKRESSSRSRDAASTRR